ncbi:MAG: hypothetical protein N3H84_05370 [Candidatus Caldarchaeum sp.]|nr:hypothetical protein [Candidatus Caldarchaeum sp.]MCX8201516.1 hypothetical protein [Candidatus Caldarchaeum sp.]MDW8434931.1 hypothetical protein [Candidatus Caldarchaeum sp.]
MRRSGLRGISVIVSALVVTAMLLSVFSVLMVAQTRLHQAEIEAMKREAEKAMESPFQIYWLNATHVRLFNNRTSVAVTLSYWITSGPGLTVTALGPPDYTVAPGTYKDVKAGDVPRVAGRTYKVVTERGNVFVVGDAPSELYSVFRLVSHQKLVRPGFSSGVNGPLTRILLGTGPEFGGGVVNLSCVQAFPAPASCSGWSVSFSPSSSMTVTSGGAAYVDVSVDIPVGTPVGSYFIRLRADTGGFVKDFLMHVLVGDFEVELRPDFVKLGRGCAAAAEVVVVPNNYDGSVSFKITYYDPPNEAVYFAFSPDPLDLKTGHTTAGLMIYVNYALTPATITAFLEASDGLGPAKGIKFEIYAFDRLPVDQC